jgi:pyridoxine 5-phosphate synthase
LKNNIKKDIRLGVNIDHVATLRNARKENFPSPVKAAELALQSGADSITAHLREDRRHIKDNDIEEISFNFPGKLNLEMAATEEMLAIAEKIKPFSCCIVPEKREEVTTEGGLNVINNHNKLKPMIARLRDVGIRTTLFIDPDDSQLNSCYDLQIDCAEIHCGTLCRLHEKNDNKFDFEFNKIKSFSEKLFSNGIEAHAGHGLNYETTKIISTINEIEELNIGFFIIAESIFHGLEKTIINIKESMIAGRLLKDK